MNTLENNITIYHTINGRRTEIKRAGMNVAQENPIDGPALNVDAVFGRVDERPDALNAIPVTRF